MGKGRGTLLQVQTEKDSCRVLTQCWKAAGWKGVWKMTDVFRELRWQKCPWKTGPAQSFVVYMLASQEKGSVN